jgi:hypothetical protein
VKLNSRITDLILIGAFIVIILLMFILPDDKRPCPGIEHYISETQALVFDPDKKIMFEDGELITFEPSSNGFFLRDRKGEIKVFLNIVRGESPNIGKKRGDLK